MLKSAILLLCTFVALVALAQSSTWPRTLSTKKAQTVMYQPEIELFDGVSLQARAAVSLKRPSDTAATFGAVWVECAVNVDRDTRMVYIRELKITNARFPETLKNTDELRTDIAEALKRDQPPIALDQLVTAMDAVKKTNARNENFKNDPPEILIATTPTTLVFIDGDPRWTEIAGSTLERVQNTPHVILRAKGTTSAYLYSTQYWYTASAVTDTWVSTTSVSKDMQTIATRIDDELRKNNGGVLPTRPQKPLTIVVRTKPSELILFDGEPSYDPIAGTQLMAAKNCSTMVFLDITSQQTFAVLSGRWFATKNVKTGPWQFVAADALPADFAKIPEGTAYDAALAYVAGTDASKEAVLDASIPQTAAVDRSTATCTVKYDGQPEFKVIDGTSMQYAVNTSSSVLLIGGTYFCCDNGVWFESKSATGPWVVSTKRPEGVDEIPASNPLYNTKYVYVYESTPTVVYVGYTPGYTGCYVMGPTVVYGTGYWYRPYGPYYYPYHATWGFHMSYSPYYGWGCGIHVGFGYGGYWGPPMYRPPYYHYPPHGYYGRGGYQPQRGYSGTPGGNRPSNMYGQGGSGGGAARPGVQPARPSNPTAGTRPSASTRPSTQPAAGSGARQTNALTDRSGNVYRPSGPGFEQHNGRGWQPASSAPTRDLNATQSQRDRSSVRTSNYGGGGARSGGGMRGGGGGGRRR